MSSRSIFSEIAMFKLLKNILMIYAFNISHIFTGVWFVSKLFVMFLGQILPDHNQRFAFQ